MGYYSETRQRNLPFWEDIDAFNYVARYDYDIEEPVPLLPGLNGIKTDLTKTVLFFFILYN